MHFRHYIICLHPPWFSADCWEGTRATAVQLVAPPGANDLKVECLVELTEFLRDEAKSYYSLAIGRDHPSEDCQPG